eukprot:TRINITY_DN10605_c0_g1_i1.p1 TRINITY_DN10605_c0_g1~~TRINITY_DN10605_c0_g1_i1.p1  ORF type:complete len:1777 (+),score=482.95 TRINITY_DN10605_c0_g1_i1:241-5571(+)
MATQQLPIQFKEIAQLGSLKTPIPQEAIVFTTCTMESEKYICVRDVTQNDKYVIVINLDDQEDIFKEKVIADSAIMAVTQPRLALRASSNTGGGAQQNLQIFDTRTKACITECVVSEVIEFWKWLDDGTLGIVTPTAVYHWTISQPKPRVIFQRLPELANTQIINYRTSADGKWCVLIGISRRNDKIVGSMQLHSLDRNISQAIDGHAATFMTYKFQGENRTLFCFANRGDRNAKLIIADPGTDAKFERKQTDIYFPPEAVADFPVAMQASEKYCVVYLITKFGYIHIFHVGTGKLIYMNRISAEPIFVTAPYNAEGGIIGVNRKGQVLSVSIDPNNVIGYIFNELRDMDLAMKLASEAGITAAADLFVQQFNIFFSQQKFKEAAEIAALSPNGILRTAQTIQRFQSLPAIGPASPVLIYFTVLLEKYKLNKIESLELVKPALQHGKRDLLETWLNEDKIEASEELGDLVAPFDANLAGKIYWLCGAKEKVVLCLARGGKVEQIASFLGANPGYKPDWIRILQDLVFSGNRKVALDIATLALKEWNSSPAQIDEASKIVDLFLTRQMVQEATTLLFELLKNDRPEEGPLQTKLLEINILQNPTVANMLFSKNAYHHYDRQHIANLCEKVPGLQQRALEHQTDSNSRKRILLSASQNLDPQFLVNWFSAIDPKEALELMKELMKGGRPNLRIVAVVAQKLAKVPGQERGIPVSDIIAMFESFQSYEGTYMFLLPFVDASQDPDVVFKFIEAATKMNQLNDVERVVKDSKVYDPEKVKEFLKAARLTDQLPLVIVCDIWNFVEDLTHYLYKNNMSQYIELYVEKINSLQTPLVVGALLDDDCNEDYIKKLVMSAAIVPIDELVAQVEKRNRLRLLKPFLETKIQQGNNEVATFNAIAKIYIEEGNENTEQFLLSNKIYDSLVIGKYCENRDPHLAYIAYKRGQNDKELIDVTNKHSLFKNQARYLVERKSPELWKYVLSPQNPFSSQVLDQVIQTALPESKSADQIVCTVTALANRPKELIELLEKLILEGNSEFSTIKDLQNLLMITAIKSEPDRVMNYVSKLHNYDALEIAELAEREGLNQEALTIYKKHNIHNSAMSTYINKLKDFEGAYDYAEEVKDPKVWSILAGGLLNINRVKDSIDAYMKANDAGNFSNVIQFAERDGLWDDLVKYLLMCRKTLKESMIESELVYAFAKTGKLAELEEFTSGPNIAQIQVIADRCYEEGMYDAAKILYTNISNFAKLATTLVRLENYSGAVEAAKKANSTKTWKEVNRALIDVKEFKLAQTAALNIVIHGDELENLIKEYEVRGYFDEIIQVLESSLNVQDQKAHMGMFTELAILYSKYRPEKLDSHLRKYAGKYTIPKVRRVTTANHQWKEVAYLDEIYEEYENAINTMISHPVEAWDHNKVKEILSHKEKIGATNEIIYKTVKFYLAEHPSLINDLLTSISSKLDNEKVVRIIEPRLLPLIRSYLESVQGNNLKGVNEALNAQYIEEEDWDALSNSIANHNNFDPLALGKSLKNLSLLTPRRIAAKLLSGLGRFDESLSLSKEDKSYSDAIQTANASNDPELVENLLRFFVENKLFEEFSASLYTCYDLVKPDVVLELAWKSNTTNLIMPFLIQVMREYSTKLATIPTPDPKKPKQNNNNIPNPNGVPVVVANGGMPGTPGMIPSVLTGDVNAMGVAGMPVVVDPSMMGMVYGPGGVVPVGMGVPGMGFGGGQPMSNPLPGQMGMGVGVPPYPGSTGAVFVGPGGAGGMIPGGNVGAGMISPVFTGRRV